MLEPQRDKHFKFKEKVLHSFTPQEVADFIVSMVGYALRA